MNSEKENSYFPTCPKCWLIPKLKLLDDEPNKISIKCPCSYNQIIPLQEYLSILYDKNSKQSNCSQCQKNIPKVKYCIQCSLFFCLECLNDHNKSNETHQIVESKLDYKNKCSSHGDNSYEYHCIDCEVDFCQGCKIKHNTHQYLNFIELLSKENSFKITNDLNKIFAQCENYEKNLKNDLISKLQDQIKRIETAYNKNIQINKNIYIFINILLYSISKITPNFTMVSNLINHSNFKCDKINLIGGPMMNGINNLISFYSTNFILDEPSVNLSQPQQQSQLDQMVEQFSPAPTPRYKDNILSKEIVKSSEKIVKFNTLNKIKKKHTIEFKCTVRGFIQLKDDRLCGWFDDGKIQIYKPNEFKAPEISKVIHSWGIMSLFQLDSGKIVTCSADNSIIILSLKKKVEKEKKEDYIEIEQTILAHKDKVYKAIPLMKGKIASCSGDKTIKIWKQTNKFDEVKTLIAHKEEVISIIQPKNKEVIVSYSNDKQLIVWNINSMNSDEMNIISELDIENINCNSLVDVGKNKVAIGGNNKIVIANISAFTIENVIYNNSFNSIDAFLLLNEFLLCGCRNGKVFQLDINNYKEISKIDNAHKSSILNILYIKSNRIATCSSDKKVHIWEFTS